MNTFSGKLVVSGLVFCVSGWCQTSGDARDRNVYEAQDGVDTSVKKLAVNVVLDQKDIWLSPFRMNKQDAWWWLTFGGVTAALIASDHEVSEQLPNRGTAVNAGNNISRAGQYYSVYPFAVGLWFVGYKWHDKKMATTGLLSVQALADAAIVANVLKEVARRDRPLNGDGGGHFEKGGSSFPSGHSIEAWSLATVVAKRYGNHKWVPWVSYAYAIAVSGSRVAGRQHFPSDVVAAGAMGYFIGRHAVNDNHKHTGLLAPTITPVMSRSDLGLGLRWDLNAH
jgi:membrane-associated phospholipid phosphatase